MSSFAGKLPIAILLYVLSSFAAAIDSTTTPLPQIAVIDFTGDATINQDQLDFISGELASELVKSKAFVVLERGKIQSILQEQGFQQSGACNSTECQVQIGQMLGVDHLVTGKLVRFGPNYAFRTEYLDVATGRIQKTISFEKSGELHEIYRDATHDAALALAKYVRPSKKSTPSTSPAASASVVTVSDTIPPNINPQVSGNSAPTQRNWKLPVVIGLAVGGIACGILGYMADRKLADERETYDNLVNPSQSEADDQWQKAVDARNQRNLLYGLGAAFLASGITVQLVF